MKDEFSKGNALSPLTLNEAVETLDGNIKALCDSVEWAIGEIARLRAANMELELKVENLRYMLRSVTQGAMQ